MRTGIKKLSLLFSMALFLFASKGIAQENDKDVPDDQELEKYVEVDLALRDIRRERQKKIMGAIEGSSLSIQRYREVSTAQNSDADMEVSEKEKKEFENVQTEIKDIRKRYDKKEKDKIREMGMEVDRFKEIQGMKTNKKVRKRMVRIQEKKMEESQEESSDR